MHGVYVGLVFMLFLVYARVCSVYSSLSSCLFFVDIMYNEEKVAIYCSSCSKRRIATQMFSGRIELFLLSIVNLAFLAVGHPQTIQLALHTYRLLCQKVY